MFASFYGEQEVLYIDQTVENLWYGEKNLLK